MVWVIHGWVIKLVDVIVAIIVTCILTFTVVRYFYEKRIQKFTSKMGHTIDEIIEGKVVNLSTSKERIEDKINYKLKRLYEIVQESVEQSQREQDSLKSLLGDISHQVNTPIANIKMYQNILIEREVSKEKQIEFLQLCNGQVDKLEFLMASMVKMSRLENGVIQLSPKKQLILPTLANALAQISQKAERKEIEVLVNCPENLSAYFDAKWTEEALFNVLDNGVKYAKDQGYLKVSVKNCDIYVLISIEDNGIGISEEEQGAIFHRFYRSPIVSYMEGVGIGLALTREIITKENGFIKVKSTIKEGSTFEIYLQKENLSKL